MITYAKKIFVQQLKSNAMLEVANGTKQKENRKERNEFNLITVKESFGED